MPQSHSRQQSQLLQQNQFFRDSIITIKSSKINDNIMIRQKFPFFFKKQLWKQITKCQPSQFLYDQSKILKHILYDQNYFKQNFKKFYTNHVRLYQWYQLANQKHHQIRQYIFTNLLKKSIPEYKIILKENSLKNTKNSLFQQSSVSENPIFCLRSMKDSPKKMVDQNKKFSTTKNSIHRAQGIFSIDKQNQNQTSQDYHQLFVKTLDACDGSKYIHYDFGRHQKGYQNRKSYNKFIRNYQLKGKSKIRDNQHNATLFQWKNQMQNKSVFVKELSQKFPNLKQRQNTFYSHQGSISKFQITHIDSQKDHKQRWGRCKTKCKTTKNLVLKKMPHVFGKQKPFSGSLVIKVHKPIMNIRV